MESQCCVFYGIVAERDPGDVPPDKVAVLLGWAGEDEWGSAVSKTGGVYNVWKHAEYHLGPYGLDIDMEYCDGYPLAHIFAEGTVIFSEDEYPVQFDQLPQYTDEQCVKLHKLAKKLGWKPPTWHLISSTEKNF